MKNDTLIREELTAFLQGGNAHMQFDEVVDNFPVSAINRKTEHLPYSPWHFLEHMRIAQWDILQFIINPKHVSPDYPEGYRPGPERKADEKQWKKTIRSFRADLKALVQLVEDQKTDLFSPIPHAPDYTIFREVLLAGDHNAYHMGEMALLRQVMDLWPEENQYYTGHAA